VSSNLDVVRAGFAAYNAGDVDGLLAVCDPEVELVPLSSLLTGAPYRGHQGVRDYLDAITEDWSKHAVELDRLIEAGDEVVLRGRFQARGRSSGVDLDAPAAWVVSLRDGRVVRLRAYTDPQAALEAVGLRES
jgi:ketosteroid isomerase-like protein